MSAGLATASADLDRADCLAIRLLSLESIAAARRVGDFMLIVPRDAAARTLRRHGKDALVAQWRESLGEEALSPVLHWRILEALPAAGSDAERRALLPIRGPLLGEIVRPAPDTLRCDLRVPFDLDVFAGHFASIPIVPAVLQVGWAVDLLRSHLHADARFAGLASAKFRRVMHPGMALTLALTRDGDRAQFEYVSGESLVSTGRLLFEAGHG